MAKFLCICLSTTIQRTINFSQLKLEQVNRSQNYRMDASGKAVNSARILTQLELGSTKVICPVGKTNGNLFMMLAAKDNIPIIAIQTPGNTRECWTLLNKSDNSTTELVVNEIKDGSNFADAQSALLSQIEDELKNCDAVLFSGSCPQNWTPGLPSLIARIICSQNKIVLVDYCGQDLLSTLELCTPTIIKINEQEYLQTFGDGVFFSEEGLRKSICQKSLELDNVIIVTRGKNPTFAANKGVFIEFATECIKPVNTTACGDAFNAGFLYEFANGANFEESLAKGTWCAARNAELETPGAIY